MCNPLTSASCILNLAAGGATGLIPGANAQAAAGGATKALAGSVTNAALGGLAGAIQDAIGAIAKDMIAWWVSLPSPDLATDPVPHTLQAWLFPFTAAVAVFGVMCAAGRMMLTRKAAPLADVGSGLLTIAITGAVATILPTLLLRAGDAYSTYVLDAATGNQFGARFTTLLAFGGYAGPGLVAILLVLGIIGMILAAAQAILLIFRQVAVIILAGMLPLAAAGSMTPLTRPWLRRVSGWMLALIFYKPAAASVYAVGFLLIGQGTTAQEVLMGFAILALSLVTLPALMRFFTWTTGQMESGGGQGLLGAVIGGGYALGAVRGGGFSASDQAQAVSSALGPGGSGPAGTGGAGPSGSGGGRGPGGGSGSGGSSGSTAATSGAASGPAGTTPAGPATGTSPAGGSSGPSAAASAAPSGAAAAGSVAPSSAAAGSAGAAAGAAGPVGVIVVGAQAAQQAARRLADGAAPPGNSP